MKRLMLLLACFWTSYIFAGQTSGGGGIIATHELVDSTSVLRVSRDDMPRAISSALLNQVVPLAIGNEEINLVPENFDFSRNELSGHIKETGKFFLLRESLEAGN